MNNVFIREITVILKQLTYFGNGYTLGELLENAVISKSISNPNIGIK